LVSRLAPRPSIAQLGLLKRGGLDIGLRMSEKGEPNCEGRHRLQRMGRPAGCSGVQRKAQGRDERPGAALARSTSDVEAAASLASRLYARGLPPSSWPSCHCVLAIVFAVISLRTNPKIGKTPAFIDQHIAWALAEGDYFRVRLERQSYGRRWNVTRLGASGSPRVRIDVASIESETVGR
jgi:hypothetical protein